MCRGMPEVEELQEKASRRRDSVLVGSWVLATEHAGPDADDRAEHPEVDGPHEDRSSPRSTASTGATVVSLDVADPGAFRARKGRRLGLPSISAAHGVARHPDQPGEVVKSAHADRRDRDLSTITGRRARRTTCTDGVHFSAEGASRSRRGAGSGRRSANTRHERFGRMKHRLPASTCRDRDGWMPAYAEWAVPVRMLADQQPVFDPRRPSSRSMRRFEEYAAATNRRAKRTAGHRLHGFTGDWALFESERFGTCTLRRDAARQRRDRLLPLRSPSRMRLVDLQTNNGDGLDGHVDEIYFLACSKDRFLLEVELLDMYFFDTNAVANNGFNAVLLLRVRGQPRTCPGPTAARRAWHGELEDQYVMAAASEASRARARRETFGEGSGGSSSRSASASAGSPGRNVSPHPQGTTG